MAEILFDGKGTLVFSSMPLMISMAKEETPHTPSLRVLIIF